MGPWARQVAEPLDGAVRIQHVKVGEGRDTPLSNKIRLNRWVPTACVSDKVHGMGGEVGSGVIVVHDG